MVYVAVYTGLRVSEVIGLRWSDIHDQSITIDERYCRGDWAAPKSDASNTTIPVNRKVIERIQRLRTLTVEVRAGRAIRRYRAVKSDGPDDLVFQSVQSGCPMRDNNILARHTGSAYQAGWKETGNRLGQLAGAQAVLRHLAKDGGDRSSRQAISHAAFPIHDHG
jgi:integrase